MTARGPSNAQPSRRTVLAIATSGALTGLAGCFASGSEEEPTTGENEVLVGPDSTYVYEPATIEIGVGETVTWTWRSNNHNVVVDDHTEAADWSGTDGGASETYDEGYEYEFTFETPGTYAYYCSPHEGMGMTGEVVVEE